MVTDTYQNKFFRKYKTQTFNLIEGKNDPTAFLLLNANTGRQIRTDSYASKENKYLLKEQSRHLYKKVESNIINIYIYLTQGQISQ